MNWSHIAGVAAGITGVTGLLGFIVFALLRISASANVDLSPAVIEKLKKSGLDPQTLKSVSPVRLRTYLAQHTDISKSLITEILGPQARARGRVLTIISIGLLILAGVLGLVYLLTGSQNAQGTKVQGNEIGQVVINPRNSTIAMSNFPKPVELQTVLDEKAGLLKVKKPEDAFVENADIVIYRYVEMRVYPNCNCLGNSTSVPMKVSSWIGKQKPSREKSEVLDAVVGNFIGESIAVGNKWVGLLAKHGMCGVIELRLPFVITYDDQFTTGRKLAFDVYRTVSLNGRGEQWTIDPISQAELSLSMENYGFAYTRAAIRGDAEDAELFEAFYRAVETIAGPKIMGEAVKAVNSEKPSSHRDLDLDTPILAVYLKRQIQQAAPRNNDEHACKIDPNAASRWMPLPDFKPVEVIGPSTEPAPPPMQSRDADATASQAMTRVAKTRRHSSP